MRAITSALLVRHEYSTMDIVTRPAIMDTSQSVCVVKDLGRRYSVEGTSLQILVFIAVIALMVAEFLLGLLGDMVQRRITDITLVRLAYPDMSEEGAVEQKVDFAEPNSVPAEEMTVVPARYHAGLWPWASVAGNVRIL